MYPSFLLAKSRGNFIERQILYCFLFSIMTSLTISTIVLKACHYILNKYDLSLALIIILDTGDIIALILIQRIK